MSCDLCDLYEKRQIVTKKYFENNLWIIVDCKQCKIPMLVYKRHARQPSREELAEIWKEIRQIWPNARARGYTRAIPQYVHWHDHIIIGGKII